MALHIAYDESIDSITIKATGVLGIEELRPLGDSILKHSDFRRNINQLFDCSEGQLHLKFEELESLAATFMRFSDQLGDNRKLALLVSRDLDFGMMRQYQALFDPGPQVSIRACRTMLEARQWLMS